VDFSALSAISDNTNARKTPPASFRWCGTETVNDT
jgi:hypothetical protein